MTESKCQGENVCRFVFRMNRMNLISDESLKTIKSTGTQPEISIFRGILTFMGPSSWMPSMMLQLDELWISWSRYRDPPVIVESIHQNLMNSIKVHYTNPWSQGVQIWLQKVLFYLQMGVNILTKNEIVAALAWRHTCSWWQWEGGACLCYSIRSWL